MAVSAPPGGSAQPRTAIAVTGSDGCIRYCVVTAWGVFPVRGSVLAQASDELHDAKLPLGGDVEPGWNRQRGKHGHAHRAGRRQGPHGSEGLFGAEPAARIRDRPPGMNRADRVGHELGRRDAALADGGCLSRRVWRGRSRGAHRMPEARVRIEMLFGAGPPAVARGDPPPAVGEVAA